MQEMMSTHPSLPVLQKIRGRCSDKQLRRERLGAQSHSLSQAGAAGQAASVRNPAGELGAAPAPESSLGSSLFCFLFGEGS